MRNFFLLSILISSISCENHNIEPYINDLPTQYEALVQTLETVADDRVKLEIYWRLYKALKSSERNIALNYLDSLKNLAEELGENEYLGKAHHGRALFLKRDGEYAKAVNEYLVAIDNYTISKSRTPLANDLNNIGVIFLEIGDYNYAIQFFLEAREHYLETNNEFLIMITNINLGTCFKKSRKPDYQKAEQYFLEALELNRLNEREQAYYFYKIHNLLGALFYKKGVFNKAIEWYESGYGYAEKLDDPAEKQMIAVMNMGEALTADGQFGQAEAAIQKAVDIGMSAAIRSQDMVECYNLMGELKQRQDNHLEAITSFEQGIAIADKNVINVKLQKTLTLISRSFRHLIDNGYDIEDRRIVDILIHKIQQDSLVRQFEENMNLRGTQEALRKQVLINGLEKKLMASNAIGVDSRKVIIATVIVALLLAITLIIIWKVYRPRSANKLIHDTLKVLTSEE